MIDVDAMFWRWFVLPVVCIVVVTGLVVGIGTYVVTVSIQQKPTEAR